MFHHLQNVFRCFSDHEVRYVVIGGIAAVAHGVPRNTFDLDVLIEATPDNASRLLEALLAAGIGTAALTDAEQLLANEITVFRDLVRIDVQTETPGLTFADAWAEKQSLTVAGAPVHVVSRNHLIASKRASGRPVDLEDVRILETNGSDDSPA